MTTPKATRKFLGDLLNKYLFAFDEEQTNIVINLIKQAYATGLEDAKSKDNATPLQDVPTTRISKRLPIEKQRPLHKFVYLIEDLLKSKIVNWGKQAKAMKMLQMAGYSEAEIEKAIREMAGDNFYSEKGFDLMTVANCIDKIVVRIREREKKNSWMYN